MAQEHKYQEHKYPSPEPAPSGHPYPNNQQSLAQDAKQQTQPAPTAMMSTEQRGDTNQDHVPPGFYAVAQYAVPQPPSTPQTLAQQSLDANGTSSIDKKNKKVSRACDECRRKKVRCDAESDQPGTQCSNCKRTNLTCQFSRQPQKRGPSKGYIKELAERVNRLETGTPGQNDIPYGAVNQSLLSPEAQAYSPHGDFATPNQRKRTHSMAEGTPRYSDGPAQLQTYASGYGPTAQPVMTTPVQHLPQPSEPSASAGLHIDPSILAGYFTHIHSGLPILPEQSAQLTSMLHVTSPELRTAFSAALTVAVRATTSTIYDQELKVAADDYLALPEKGHSYSTTSYGLVRLQTLIFLTIAEEYAGPALSRSGKWLGSAITLAKTLNIRRRKQKDITSRSELGNLLRRSWLSLIILDRWHASAICGSPNIPDTDAQLNEFDHALLGSSSYHILRISLALGHLSDAFLNAPHPPNSKDVPHWLKSLMRGEVSRLDESISPHFESLPLVHLAHLHLRMLSDKATESVSGSGEQASIEAAIAAISLLGSKALAQNSPTPLEHHVLALTTALLAYALPSHGKPVADTLVDLRSWCENGQARVAPGWRDSVIGAISQVLAKGGLPVRDDESGGREGLLSLADAAMTGKGPGRQGDWSVVLERGYLSLFE